MTRLIRRNSPLRPLTRHTDPAQRRTSYLGPSQLESPLADRQTPRFDESDIDHGHHLAACVRDVVGANGCPPPVICWGTDSAHLSVWDRERVRSRRFAPKSYSQCQARDYDQSHARPHLRRLYRQPARSSPRTCPLATETFPVREGERILHGTRISTSRSQVNSDLASYLYSCGPGYRRCGLLGKSGTGWICRAVTGGWCRSRISRGTPIVVPRARFIPNDPRRAKFDPVLAIGEVGRADLVASRGLFGPSGGGLRRFRTRPAELPSTTSRGGTHPECCGPTRSIGEGVCEAT